LISIIQRVTKASVSIQNNITGTIDHGLMVLVGIEELDDIRDVDWISRKIVNLRIFNDENGVMNKNLIDAKGNILLISQFTLHASTKKGNRPSYVKAAKPEIAIPLYKNLITKIETDLGRKIQTGEFGADMQVSLTNDGPVTIILDSKNKQ